MQGLIFRGDIIGLMKAAKKAYVWWVVVGVLAISITIVAPTINFSVLRHGIAMNMALLFDANPALWWTQLGFGILLLMIFGWIAWQTVNYLLKHTYLYHHAFGFSRRTWGSLAILLGSGVLWGGFLWVTWQLLYQIDELKEWLRWGLMTIAGMLYSLASLRLTIWMLHWLVRGVYYQGTYRRYEAVFWGNGVSSARYLLGVIALQTISTIGIYIVILNTLQALQTGMSVMALLRVQLIGSYLFLLLSTMIAPLWLITIIRYTLGYTTIKGIKASFKGQLHDLLMVFTMIFLFQAMIYTLIAVLQFFVSWQTTFSLILFLVASFFQYIIFSWLVLTLYHWLIENIVINEL